MKSMGRLTNVAVLLLSIACMIFQFTVALLLVFCHYVTADNINYFLFLPFAHFSLFIHKISFLFSKRSVSIVI